MKSIVIICKGPSVKRCTREFIDQFDEVVICGYPVLDNFFFKLISGKKIKFHFANCGDFDKRYTDKINELLKIDKVINTNVSNNYMNFLENKDDTISNKNSNIDFCKNIIKPSSNELKEHQNFLKKSLKKNYF